MAIPLDTLSQRLALAEVTGDGFVWRMYRPNEAIVSRFTTAEWRLINSSFDTDRDWSDYVQECSGVIVCYVLERSIDKASVGFCYLQEQRLGGRKVEIHGGGWHRDSSLLYYHALRAITTEIQSRGYVVRSSCQRDNRRALRFLAALGFRPCGRRGDYTLLRL